MDKFPTPGNCNRLEVVRVNPEIFNSVRKEVKTEDVMLQKAQKPLFNGIIAATRILDDFMKAEKGEKLLPSTESVMKILSDSISLLSDVSHETDVRRGRYKSRTGSSRTASPGRINSDRLGS